MMYLLLAGVSSLALLPFVGGFGSAGGYQIARSLRFRPNNTYGVKTPAATNRNLWTISVEMKRTLFATAQTVFSCGASSDDRFYFDTSDRFCVDIAGTVRLVSTRVFRDPAAWSRIVVVYDAANGSASLRLRVFVNNEEITTWTTDTRSGITTGTANIGTATNYCIGLRWSTGTEYYGGYLADFAFAAGVATTTYGGSLDALTNTWVPAQPSAPVIWLDWRDNSSVAAAWTDRGSDAVSWGGPVGFSVTAGVTNDSLTDTPTNYGTDTGVGGEVRGNYCTLNPLLKASALSLTAGNLSVAATTNWLAVGGTFAVSSGKWYYEMSADLTNPLAMCGWAQNDEDTANTFGVAVTKMWTFYLNPGTKYGNGANAVAYRGSGVTANTIVGVALDLDNGTLEFFVGGVSQGVAFNTGLTGKTLLPWFPVNNGAGAFTTSVNFGQRPFTYTAPSGFKACCTQNLPTPAILKPNQYFDVNMRVGTGAAFNVTGKAFQPDLVWSKSRSAATGHAMETSADGAGVYFSPNTGTGTVDAQAVTTFNADGFSGGTATILNANAATFVDWLMKKGATSGYDQVKYNGDNTANRNISHSVLGVAPKMVILKRRDATSKWWVWHTSLTGATYFEDLSSTAAQTATNSPWGTGNFSSTQFMVTNNGTENSNGTGADYIAHLFAEVPGFSKFGSYTGNANADGPFIWCGFRPRFIMIKRTDAAGNWIIIDTARQAYNILGSDLWANLSTAEGADAYADILSNGFKLRSIGVDVNASSGTYIFAAFAEAPFKYARAR